MKRELIAMRKVVTPMRDMLGAVFTGVVDLPGFDPENSGWLRDAYDHMIRISDLVDSYRDLLTGAMDVYLSTVSNRLNSVMKQLTVIATVFLPLTFVTGFFGQNFLWLTNHIQPAWTFWVFGIGVEAIIVLGMLSCSAADGGSDRRRRRGSYSGAEDPADAARSPSNQKPCTPEALYSRRQGHESFPYEDRFEVNRRLPAEGRPREEVLPSCTRSPKRRMPSGRRASAQGRCTAATTSTTST